MTFKIIAVAAAVVGFSLGSTAGFAASARRAAADPIGAVHSVAQAGQLGHPGPQAKRRPAIKPSANEPTADGQRAFGSGCRILPRNGPGSDSALAQVPVAAAVSQVPGLSELARALQRADLARTLNATGALTLFAPDNAAFDALGAGNLQALLATGPDLVRVLKFHMVAGRLTPAELARRHVVTTMAGTRLSLARAGHTVAVNNATVTCGNVQAANATVYVVSRLIVPTS
jgi:uncharacterized surface protein with fasciclin (FAS1) repeats